MGKNVGDNGSPLHADDLAPDPKANMTSAFGRFVERVSYVDIAIVVTVILAVSTGWFAIAPEKQGLLKANGPVDALYFTLVTFTSLGYGDLVPAGAGRAVAVLDVVSGLALIAILIGKVASERQASLLTLLHTSDTQRRISDFTRELVTLREHIETGSGKKDIPTLNRALQRHVKLGRAIKNYLVFNSHQAIVVEFGNFTALIGLYYEIRESFDFFEKCLRDANRLGDAEVMDRLFASLNGLHQLVEQMARIHHSPRTRGPFWRSILQWARVIKPLERSPAEQSARNRVSRLARSMKERIGEIQTWIARAHHPIQTRRVLSAWPAGPRCTWEVGIHKVVARKLHLSNSVVSRCVDDLLATGALPKGGSGSAPTALLPEAVSPGPTPESA